MIFSYKTKTTNDRRQKHSPMLKSATVLIAQYLQFLMALSLVACSNRTYSNLSAIFN